VKPMSLTVALGVLLAASKVWVKSTIVSGHRGGAGVAGSGGGEALQEQGHSSRHSSCHSIDRVSPSTWMGSHT